LSGAPQNARYASAARGGSTARHAAATAVHACRLTFHIHLNTETPFVETIDAAMPQRHAVAARR